MLSGAIGIQKFLKCVFFCFFKGLAPTCSSPGLASLQKQMRNNGYVWEAEIQHGLSCAALCSDSKLCLWSSSGLPLGDTQFRSHFRAGKPLAAGTVKAGLSFSLELRKGLFFGYHRFAYFIFCCALDIFMSFSSRGLGCTLDPCAPQMGLQPWSVLLSLPQSQV